VTHRIAEVRRRVAGRLGRLDSRQSTTRRHRYLR
jgi:hypothetical protein